MPLFQVAILRKPTRKQKEEEGKDEELILAPINVIAKSGPAAAMKVTIDHAAALKDEDPSRIDIIAVSFQ